MIASFIELAISSSLSVIWLSSTLESLLSELLSLVSSLVPSSDSIIWSAIELSEEVLLSFWLLFSVSWDGFSTGVSCVYSKLSSVVVYVGTVASLVSVLSVFILLSL